MKKLIFSLLLLGALSITATPASARGVIVYSNGETIEVVQKVPDDVIFEEFVEEHVNIGVMYDQFSIFWIPMWNYGETVHVLINDAEDTYYDLSVEEIEYLNEEYGLEISTAPRIGFWNKIGGKMIWGAVLLFFVWGAINRKKGDEEPVAQSEEQEPATEETATE